MPKLMVAGLAGGAVLLLWRIVFHAVVPEGSPCGTDPAASWSWAPRPLLRELLGYIGAALIAASVLASRPAGARGVLAMGAALGLFAWFTQGFPLWNRHEAPAAFVLGEAFRQVSGWALAAGAMAVVMRRMGSDPAP